MYIIVINPTAISKLLHPSNNHGHVEQCSDFNTKLNVQLIACRFENIIRQALGIKHKPAGL